jgi:MFS family permease
METGKTDNTGEKVNTAEKVKKSLRYSILDGAFWSMMVGFGEWFFAPFAIFLNATNTQIGILGSLPQALGAISQLFSNKLIRIFNSRKKVVCLGVLIESFVFIPATLVFFFDGFKVWYLVISVTIYWILGSIINPAWSSWMGDLVDAHGRGDYFGKRNRITGIVTFCSFLTAGYILHHFTDGTTRQFYGFAIIFAIAMSSRLISFIYLTKKYEPTYIPAPESEFTFFEFIKQAGERNFGRFVIYMCCMNFSVYLCAPFFTAYMLSDLNYGYLAFTVVNAAAVVTKFATMPIWGKISDKYGTKKVLSVSGFLMPVVPLLWIFSNEVWYLIIVQAYSGFVWAGFELAAFNFVFDATTPQKRMTCVAYYNVLNGVAILAGAMLGTIIVTYNSIFWSRYILVFVVSFALRYLISFALIPKIKEVRNVEEITYKEMMQQFLVIRPQNFMMMHIPARLQVIHELPGMDKIKNMNHKIKNRMTKFKKELKKTR